MDTIDRPDANVPARFPMDSPRVPAPIAGISHDLALPTPTPSQVSPRVILRGLNRHKWRILLFSLVLYAPLAYAIMTLVKPSYEAYSLLEIEPTPELLNPRRETPDLRSALPYIQTQVELITSDHVLDEAVSQKSIPIINYPMIKLSEDPKADLRAAMS